MTSLFISSIAWWRPSPFLSEHYNSFQLAFLTQVFLPFSSISKSKTDYILSLLITLQVGHPVPFEILFSLSLQVTQFPVPSPVTAPSYFYSWVLFTCHFNCTKIPLFHSLLFSLYTVSFCMAATTTCMLTGPTSSFPALTSHSTPRPNFYLPTELIIFPIKPTPLAYHTLQTILKVCPKLEA